VAAPVSELSPCTKMPIYTFSYGHTGNYQAQCKATMKHH